MQNQIYLIQFVQFELSNNFIKLYEDINYKMYLKENF